MAKEVTATEVSTIRNGGELQSHIAIPETDVNDDDSESILDVKIPRKKNTAAKRTRKAPSEDGEKIEKKSKLVDTSENMDKNEQFSKANIDNICMSPPRKEKDGDVSILSDTTLVSPIPHEMTPVVTPSKKDNAASFVNDKEVVMNEENNNKNNDGLLEEESTPITIDDEPEVNVEVPATKVIINPYAKKYNTTATSNSNDDFDYTGLGINQIPLNSGSTGQVHLQKAQATLRCVIIQNNITQTVVFYCEELTRWAFKCQGKISQDMKDQKDWVTKIVPFAAPNNEPNYSLYLHRHNRFVRGQHGKYGLRLFHYTNQKPFQMNEQIYATASFIVKKVNENCTAELTADRNTLMVYNKPCVWNNILLEKDCYDKLKRETGEDINDDNSYNPRFWDKHKEVISKYFYSNKMTLEQAQAFNAPLECISLAYPRTPELMKAVAFRRNAISIEEMESEMLPDNRDPEDEFGAMYNATKGNSTDEHKIQGTTE
jgi:hypothetical protein